jgi:hypothetical protein
MDLDHGVLLLLLGTLVTIGVFSIIFYVERPPKKEDDKSEVKKSLDDIRKL